MSASNPSLRNDVLLSRIGVDSQYTRLNAAGFLSTSAIGISLVVFLNAAQPFVLTELLDVSKSQIGKVAGTLIFADELLSLILVLIWGRIADVTSPRLVVVVSNCFAALALCLTVQASKPFPQLLLTRLLFGVGASGITSMLSALLTSMAARNDASHDIVQPLTPASEEQPLLGWRRPAPDTVTGKRPKSPHARLAALLGISTGLGALLAVFFFLRLPTILHSHNDTAGGLRRAFRLVAAVALMNACWAAFTLPQSQATITSAPSFSHSEPQKNKVRRICSGITAELLQLCQGFVLGSRNATIALGFASGFIARAQVITVSAFIPLYVVVYYQEQGLCTIRPGDDVKTDCHAAYAFASALTGVIQLVTLLAAPIFAFTRSPSRALAWSLLTGTFAFAILGRSAIVAIVKAHTTAVPNPKNPWTWVAAVAAGVSQTGAITLSLALVAQGKAAVDKQDEETRKHVAHDPILAAATASPTADASHIATSTRAASTTDLHASQQLASGARIYQVTSDTASDQAIFHGITNQIGQAKGDTLAQPLSDTPTWSPVSAQTEPDWQRNAKYSLTSPKRSVAGALAGAYSFCGGCGILFVSGLGGYLSDKQASAPFLLIAILNLGLATVAAVTSRRETRRTINS